MERWNAAMEAIEQDLDGEIDVTRIAQVALTSEYQLRRVFSVLAGMSLSQYIRRRRMTVAAAAVLEGTAVQDIAIRYGYTSADAFARAFRAVHGVRPEQARRPGAVLRSQQPLAFHLRIEGSSEMEYRIEHKDAFRIVGRKARIPLVYEGLNPDMVAFAESVTEDDYAQIDGLSDQEPAGVLSVCDNFEESRADGSLFDYYVAAVSSKAAPEGLDVLEVPAGTWAVFTSSGPLPESLQQLWPQAFAEWLPANPYELVPGPELVRADYDPDGTSGEGELWLPVRQKA